MPLPKRTLPEFILTAYREEYEKNKDAIGEEFDVQRKFSKRSAQFGEKTTDQVALGYMCPEAALYWLPRFIEYIMHLMQRGVVSNHHELFLFSLSNKRFVNPFRPLISVEECQMILRYLDWFEWNLGPLDLEVNAEDIATARDLWNGLISELES